jgi:hypothetical protein
MTALDCVAKTSSAGELLRWTWHLPLRGLPQRHRANPSAALDEPDV